MISTLEACYHCAMGRRFSNSGGGGVDRAPQHFWGGVWDKGSIDRTIDQLHLEPSPR